MVPAEHGFRLDEVTAAEEHHAPEDLQLRVEGVKLRRLECWQNGRVFKF